MGFFTGTKGKFQTVPTLNPRQQRTLGSLLGSLEAPGGAGAYGQVADYYRDLLGPNSATANEMFAPEVRRFNEETIPGLAEQFAGMGAGNIHSSSFRNAGIRAGTDLAERLAAMRAQLRLQGAQGLAGLGAQGLGNYQENVYRERTPGFIENVAPLLGQIPSAIAGSYFGNAGAGQVASALASQAPRAGVTSSSPTAGSTSPYGGGALNYGGQSGFRLPNFLER